MMNEDLSFLDYFSNFIVDLPAPGVEIGFDVLTAISLMIGFLGFFWSAYKNRMLKRQEEISRIIDKLLNFSKELSESRRKSDECQDVVIKELRYYLKYRLKPALSTWLNNQTIVPVYRKVKKLDEYIDENNLASCSSAGVEAKIDILMKTIVGDKEDKRLMLLSINEFSSAEIGFSYIKLAIDNFFDFLKWLFRTKFFILIALFALYKSYSYILGLFVEFSPSLSKWLGLFDSTSMAIFLQTLFTTSIYVFIVHTYLTWQKKCKEHDAPMKKDEDLKMIDIAFSRVLIVVLFTLVWALVFWAWGNMN
jgi:hypothetical protein